MVTCGLWPVTFGSFRPLQGCCSGYPFRNNLIMYGIICRRIISGEITLE